MGPNTDAWLQTTSPSRMFPWRYSVDYRQNRAAQQWHTRLVCSRRRIDAQLTAGTPLDGVWCHLFRTQELTGPALDTAGERIFVRGARLDPCGEVCLRDPGHHVRRATCIVWILDHRLRDIFRRALQGQRMMGAGPACPNVHGPFAASLSITSLCTAYIQHTLRISNLVHGPLRLCCDDYSSTQVYIDHSSVWLSSLVSTPSSIARVTQHSYTLGSSCGVDILSSYSRQCNSSAAPHVLTPA